MKRSESLRAIQSSPNKIWDIVVIGGGATGLGAGVDAASRGFETLVLEKYDFAKGTSSRSTKLVHGGVRYLAAGDIAMVLEALNERGLLLQNAPHLVQNQKFIIPNYEWWDLSLIHISEPTRLGMISYAVFCLKKKKQKKNQII